MCSSDLYKWPRDKLNVRFIYEEVEAMVALEQSKSDEKLQSMRRDVRNALEKTQRVSMMRGRGAGGNSWRIRDYGEGHGQPTVRGRGPLYPPPPFLGPSAQGGPRVPTPAPRGLYDFSFNYSGARRSHADQDDNWRN